MLVFSCCSLATTKEHSREPLPPSKGAGASTSSPTLTSLWSSWHNLLQVALDFGGAFTKSSLVNARIQHHLGNPGKMLFLSDNFNIQNNLQALFVAGKKKTTLLHTDPPKVSVSFSWASSAQDTGISDSYWKKRFVAIDDGRWISRIPYPTNPEGQTLQWGKLQDWTTENGASLQHCAGEHLKSSRRGWKFWLMIWRKKTANYSQMWVGLESLETLSFFLVAMKWIAVAGITLRSVCGIYSPRMPGLPTRNTCWKAGKSRKKPLQCYLVGGRWKVCEIGFSLSEALEKEWKGLGKFVRNLSSLPTKLASMTPVDPYTSNTRCFNMSTSVTRICAMFVRDKTTVRVETRWYPVGKVRHHEASQCENWFVCVCV